MQENFFEWLDRVLETNPLPPEIIAVNFNLYEESEDNTYSIQLVGADYFDEDNADWACDTPYSSEEDLFIFVDKYNTDDENDCERALETCSALITAYLNKGKFADLLNGMQAVAYGHVDGELEILHTNRA